jgi:hypothetical protein
MIQKLSFLFAILGLLFIVACEDDEPAPVDIVEPSISLSDVGNVDGSIVLPGDTLRVSIQGMAGTNELAFVRFFENEERLPNFATRLFVNDSLSPTTQLNIDPESSNRQQLEIDIRILAAELGGNYNVEIELADEDNNASRVSFSYFVKDVETSEGVLVNAAQDDNTGGLILATGQGTGDDDDDADIIDLGINSDLPDAENWVQRIASIDTSIVKLAIFPPSFEFDEVLTKARVSESFDEGQEVAETGTLEVGDVFAVQRGEEAYLLRVSEVNVSPNDNSDSYTFEIKQ